MEIPKKIEKTMKADSEQKEGNSYTSMNPKVLFSEIMNKRDP